jgi:hypothetical protein
MPTVIPALGDIVIEHGTLVEFTTQEPQAPGDTNPKVERTYRISNCYKDIYLNEGDAFEDRFIATGAFLSIGEIQNNLQNAVDELAITLSAIPEGYLDLILDTQIKGGNIKVYRVFFDPTTQLVQEISGIKQIFQRFNGIVNNYAVQEDLDQNSANPSTTHNITLTCSSILSVLENRVSGRRTNRGSYNYRYLDRQITLSAAEGVWGNLVLGSGVVTDKSMNRIETLHNAQFDFGKDAGGNTTSGAGSGGGGSADSSKNPPADNYNPYE